MQFIQEPLLGIEPSNPFQHAFFLVVRQSEVLTEHPDIQWLTSQRVLTPRMFKAIRGCPIPDFLVGDDSPELTIHTQEYFIAFTTHHRDERRTNVIDSPLPSSLNFHLGHHGDCLLYRIHRDLHRRHPPTP